MSSTANGFAKGKWDDACNWPGCHIGTIESMYSKQNSLSLLSVCLFLLSPKPAVLFFWFSLLVYSTTIIWFPKSKTLESFETSSSPSPPTINLQLSSVTSTADHLIHLHLLHCHHLHSRPCLFPTWFGLTPQRSLHVPLKPFSTHCLNRWFKQFNQVLSSLQSFRMPYAKSFMIWPFLSL